MRIVQKIGEMSGSWRGRLEGRFRHRVYCLSDGSGWVLDREADLLSRGLQERGGPTPRIVNSPEALRHLCRQVVHFGSQELFTEVGYNYVNPSNAAIVTFYHGDPSQPGFEAHVESFMRLQSRVSQTIVSCSIMESRLKTWGVNPASIVRIPIGVDLELFRCRTDAGRAAARRRLGIPEGRVVIGSFLKDGCGWGDGAEPKWVKGPDVLVSVLADLNRHIPVFALLAGPSRGFVRDGLTRAGVPFGHRLLDNYDDVVALYHACDATVITSREEGGPKMVMESMATGVPLVSTRVGMAVDLVTDGVSGRLCDVDDVDGLVAALRDVIQGDSQSLVAGGLDAVQTCDYRRVAERLARDVYEPLLERV